MGSLVTQQTRDPTSRMPERARPDPWETWAGDRPGPPGRTSGADRGLRSEAVRRGRLMRPHRLWAALCVGVLGIVAAPRTSAQGFDPGCTLPFAPIAAPR